MAGLIQPVVMPKWGLAMTEGQVVAWLIEPGEEVSAGDELLEIETTKITNVLEAAAEGVLRRRDTAARARPWLPAAQPPWPSRWRPLWPPRVWRPRT